MTNCGGTINVNKKVKSFVTFDPADHYVIIYTKISITLQYSIISIMLVEMYIPLHYTIR